VKTRRLRKRLLQELDADMTGAELRVGFTEIHANQISRISMDEFRAWRLSN
jgi:hypothetical protein